MKRLIPKSRFRDRPTTVDSVAERVRRAGDKGKTNMPLLNRCRSCWENLDGFRKTRLRNLRYVFGDQWGDMVKDKGGKYVTERERISRRTGGIVLQNNHLIKIVNTLVGLYAKTATLPVCFARQKDCDRKSQMMTNALQTNWENNMMKDLLISEMTDFVCGGASIVVEEWSSHNGIEDSYTYPVDPSFFFFESKTNDPRHWDDSLVGEIRDYTLGELAAVLAKSEYDYRQLEEIYAPYINRSSFMTDSNTDAKDSLSFDWGSSVAPCRAYHVWTLENKPRYRCVDMMDFDQPLYRIEVEDLPDVEAANAERMRMGLAQGMPEDEIPLIEYEYIVDQYWHFQMLAPDGRVLDEYDCPYEHLSHPYTYKMHYFVNGHVIPFISVVIDQQRYINRLISLHDLIMQSSAKGVKMIPKDCVPEGMTERRFAEKFTEIGDFIFYTPSKSGNKPEIITSNSTNIGTAELLQVELGFMNDITSVSESLQGKTPGSGVAASRYAMETQNSTTSISGLIAKFSTFEGEVARKKMKTMHQYYTSPRNISLEHSAGYAEYEEYDPKEVQDIDFKVSIKESAESPVSRMMNNELFKEMWAAGQLSAEQLLTFGYFPGSEGLLQSLQASREQMEQGGTPGQIPQGEIDGATAGADPAAVAQLQQALRTD